MDVNQDQVPPVDVDITFSCISTNYELYALNLSLDFSVSHTLGKPTTGSLWGTTSADNSKKQFIFTDLPILGSN